MEDIDLGRETESLPRETSDYTFSDPDGNALDWMDGLDWIDASDWWNRMEFTEFRELMTQCDNGYSKSW